MTDIQSNYLKPLTMLKSRRKHKQRAAMFVLCSHIKDSNRTMLHAFCLAALLLKIQTEQYVIRRL